MMTTEEFRRHAHELVDWMADYLGEIERLPVRSPLPPRATIDRLPLHPPIEPQDFPAIFEDFRTIILPGMTHWQHPSFFAYFPANSSPPSILAEMLTATLGAQCMNWITSPAATELEERVMGWLREMIGLPGEFTGVIQDTASTATICAILSARERSTSYQINENGFPPDKKFAVYASSEANSSIEKGVKIAGLGARSLRKIPVDDAYAMIPGELQRAVERDIAEGVIPLCVISTLGTTGSTAIDPLAPIASLCRKHGIWLHVDAAYAGSALVLPEMRWMIEGIGDADSFVFNPHKWMFTNFDCSAYFVRDEGALIRTFEILPEYLKTQVKERVNNYRDWGIQLGRRFRALKLWFVIRNFGVSGLQERIRAHLALAQSFARSVRESKDFELLAPVPLAAVCFRYHPPSINDAEALNALNIRLMEALNATGRLYLTHTKLAGRVALRLVTSQTNVSQRHIDAAWSEITAAAKNL